ncbi:MAG: hypothetical protein ACXWNZ_00630 [Vulcanimicrobiaceae bacterium]
MTHAVFSDYAKIIAAVGALIVVSAPPAPAIDGDTAFAAARARNPSLTAYTFHMNVAMAMHHFPWLHFRVEGTGQYIRGQDYVVHFTQMPFFAKGINKIDLSALDPSMWQARYNVSVAAENDGMKTFSLHPRETDPNDKNPLAQALVTLDTNDATREVRLQYADGGEIHLSLTPGDTDGFRLPVTCDAEINMPGQALSAHADFTDYTIMRSGLGENSN